MSDKAMNADGPVFPPVPPTRVPGDDEVLLRRVAQLLARVVDVRVLGIGKIPGIASPNAENPSNRPVISRRVCQCLISDLTANSLSERYGLLILLIYQVLGLLDLMLG